MKVTFVSTGIIGMADDLQNLNNLFLGRQPILDTTQNLIAYELLFRSANSLHANVTDEVQACAHVIVHALSDFGIEDTLGKNKGFINVSREILMTDTLELLPKDQVVIELLETIKPTRPVVERCKALKDKGFSLALDDHVFHSSFTPLYELVDIIKIDLLLPTLSPLQDIVKSFRDWPVKLLAEKVETYEQFHKCRDHGFEMFQGYYFAKPIVMQQRTINVGTMTLMRLMDQVLQDAELSEIEETFKQNPELIFNLLRLVNSVYMGMREKIKALRHAISILGREHLKRWIMLSLYATGSKGVHSSPLMEMAAVRGKFMELLVKKHSVWQKDADVADRAFMAGVLSLIDALFNVKMEDVIKQCNVTDDVRGALLERSGLLGNLLVISEHLEHSRFDELPRLLLPMQLSPEDFSMAQREAIKWANKFMGT